MSADDQKNSGEKRIETEGGAYVGGNVDTGGGDFTGRDRIIHGDYVQGDKITIVHQGVSPQADAARTAAVPLAHQPFEPETVLIPGGPFLMGSEPGPGVPEHETPQHEVDLPAYRIAKYPVSNAQYAEFVTQAGVAVAPEAGWTLAAVGQVPPPGQEHHPAVGVSWDEATAYCRWLSERTGRPYRLPSEAEWEKAARGADGRRYPWGDDFDAARCNGVSSDLGGTMPVGSFSPMGDSSCGCADMAGNVWEWTNTRWGR